MDVKRGDAADLMARPVAMLLALLTSGCFEPTPRIAVVERRVSSIELFEGPSDDPNAIGGAGATKHIAALLTLDPSSSPMGRDERIKIRFLTDDGDSEEVLAPAVSLIVIMRPGHVIREVEDRLAALGGGVSITFQKGGGAGVWVSGDYSAKAAAKEIAGWPGVASAFPDEGGTLPAAYLAPLPVSALVSIAFSMQRIPGDRRLSFSRSLTTAEYRQPDGTVLTASSHKQ